MKSLPLAIIGVVLFAPAATAQFKGRRSGVETRLVGNSSTGTSGGAVGRAWATSKELAPECPVEWNVKVITLHGGRQEGVHLVRLDNGRMRITLVPTRGMGILRVETGEVRLAWDSPVAQIVNSAFINLSARGGLGFLEGFNEFMCRCGLENIGQPGKDEIVTNTGAKAEVELTLHGKIANIPALHVDLHADTKPPYRIRIKGLVRESMMFGPNFDLYTEYSTEAGSTAFRIEDTVVNNSSQPQEFQMLYHTNFGVPFLNKGSRFLAPVRRVVPVNAHSAKDVKHYGDIAGPTPGIIEQAYFFDPLADKAGRATALIHNKDKSQGVSMQWAVKQLPYLTLWKNTAAIQDGYVVGIEPGTSFPNTRRVERKAGRVPKLAGGAVAQDGDRFPHSRGEGTRAGDRAG